MILKTIMMNIKCGEIDSEVSGGFFQQNIKIIRILPEDYPVRYPNIPKQKQGK